MKNFRYLAVSTALTLVLSFPAFSQTTLPEPASNPNDVAALTRLRLALDTLSAGNSLAARVLAEDGVQKYGDYPELSFLLAYLLQGENRNAEAVAALEHSDAPSSLAKQYSSLLKNQTPQPEEVAQNDSTTNATATRLPQSDARLGAFEATMVKLVNEERRKLGLSSLATDSQLSDIARAHSAEMRDKNYFLHDSPTPALREPMDRYRAVVKDTPRIVAENIYRVYSYGSADARRSVSEADVRAGHDALMKSPGHRANILEPRITRLGIGIVANAKGDMWITQMFAKP